MAKPFNLKWSSGNEKLNKDNGGVYTIIGFGIPADTNFDHNGHTYNTCPAARDCRDICYAKQGFYRSPAVIASRNHNLQMTLQSDFVDMAIADLKRMRKYNTVRIHDSGDFYSQDYYFKWCDIARAFPDKTFYAYTKSVHFWLYPEKPDNLHITQSLGGRYDGYVDTDKPHSRIFANHEARIREGYVDGNVNDVPAIQGLVKIGLVYHGNKNLTEGQKKYFG